MITKMSVEEEKWKAECDARTLAEAEVIKADKQRLAKAQSAAKEMIKETQLRTRGLAKVAKSGNTCSKYNNSATIGKL